MRNPEVNRMTREEFLAELEVLASGLRDLHVIVDAGKTERRVQPVRRKRTGLRHEAK